VGVNPQLMKVSNVLTVFFGVLMFSLFLPEVLAQTRDRDLGVRPEVDGEDHSPTEMDPSKKNLRAPPLMFLRQKRIAARIGVRRLLVTPIVAAAKKESRERSAKIYSEQVIENPADFSFLQVNASQHVPIRENTATFINDTYEFRGIARNSFGFCWGVTTMNRLFAHLAFYQADIYPENQVPDAAQVGRKKWLAYYTAKIDSIFAGNAELIPGYKNFRELTMEPEIELYLKRKSVKTWADRAIQPWDRSFFRGTNDEEMSAKETENLVADLKVRLARHELPKLMFTSYASGTKLGVPVWIHTVLVYKVEDLSDGTKRIQLWDPDKYGEDLVEHPHYLEIRPDGTILFAPWYEKDNPKTSDVIGKVFYAPENDEETLQILKGVKTFCSQHTDLCSPR
jgi:hypothetical protein